MEVPVGGDIGEEVHTVDQILIFTSGKGRAEISGKHQDIEANDVVIVPAGSLHQVCFDCFGVRDVIVGKPRCTDYLLFVDEQSVEEE